MLSLFLQLVSLKLYPNKKFKNLKSPSQGEVHSRLLLPFSRKAIEISE